MIGLDLRGKVALVCGAGGGGLGSAVSRILAGAYLGDDGLLGGTGSNADTYGAGTIGSNRGAVTSTKALGSSTPAA